LVISTISTTVTIFIDRMFLPLVRAEGDTPMVRTTVAERGGDW
jgi:hypothetical protein